MKKNYMFEAALKSIDQRVEEEISRDPTLKKIAELQCYRKRLGEEFSKMMALENGFRTREEQKKFDAEFLRLAILSQLCNRELNNLRKKEAKNRLIKSRRR